MNEICDLNLDIQSIEIANYTLKPMYSLNAKSKSLNLKEGFLLKIDFKSFGFGYADCFSWVELGDISLNQQIEYIKNSIYNTQLEKSIYFACIDAQYRSKNQNIFKNLNLLKNHYTCVNYNELSYDFIEDLSNKGFSIIKIKCGISIKNEIALIKNRTLFLRKLKISIRLDFNSSLDLKGICYFLSSIEDSLDIISFIEDPLIYDKNEWKKIKNLFPRVFLAIDRVHKNFFEENEKNHVNSFDYFVFKPAVQNIRKIFKKNSDLKNKRFLFTSYMDHPLGQLSALYEASLFYENALQMRQCCGFLTHTLYDKNLYSETLSILDAKLIPSLEGSGFGFDALFGRELWRKIK